MSCFTGNCEGNVSPDPHRRVNYVNGLVLGVDEFIQEEIYFLEQNREHNRGLHGYGTVCGLFVEIQNTPAEGPQIWVGPGAAVDPKGRVIRVPQAQCARINDWLQRFGNTLGSPPAFSSPNGSPDLVRLYLKLCYRECKTENVPIPGGPCRSADETSVPSRIADDFKLELSLTPPDQTEADVVREFGALLRSIEFSTAQTTLTLDEWATLVRSLGASGSPSSPPLPMPAGSPPGFYIHPQDADEFIRLAFRIWVTEVRPNLLPNGGNCVGGPPKECCVLLAEIAFPVREAGGQLIVDGDASAVQLNQHRRPYLIHTQLLQELWSGGATFQQIIGGGGGGPLPPGSPDVAGDHGSLTGLEDDDHPQYLLVRDRSGSPPAAADFLLRELSGDDTHHVTGLPFARPGFRDAIPVGQQAGLPAFGAVGDLTGTYPNPSIARLQGQPVNAPAPSENQVLRFVGGQWIAAPLPAPPPPPPPDILETNLVRIHALSWRHNTLLSDPIVNLSVPTTPLGGQRQNIPGLVIVFGQDQPGDATVQVRDGSADPDTFQVFLEIPIDGRPNLVDRVRLLPRGGRILPVRPDNPANPAAGITEVPDPEAPAIFFPLPENASDLLRPAGRLIIYLRGDHVVDRAGRAVDAEFTRSQLPTGDRPNNVRQGIQGGTFYSWLDLPSQTPGFGGRRFRDARLEDLIGLIPAINEDLARRILEFRDNNPNLTSFESLRSANGGVPGVGTAIVSAISQAFTL